MVHGVELRRAGRDWLVALAVEKKSALTIERDGACMKQMCELCARVCDMHATECAKHAHVHCKDCAQACIRCVEACRAMS